MKHLLKLMDCSSEEIFEILEVAVQLKAETKAGKKHAFPAGKTLAMIFSKHSTRTRVSFETGIFQLGGHGIYLSNSDSQLGRGEPIQDTARVLSRYCDALMMRTYRQEEIEALAKFSSVPVINGLTDFAHPCQVLADLLTIQEMKGTLEGVKVAYIGDGNNMANSWIVGALKCRMNISVATPKGYEPDFQVLDFAAHGFPENFELTHSPEAAAKNADVVVTDVWSSMGDEQEAEARKGIFAGFCVNKTLLRVAKKGCMVQHCLPAHRGEEIAADVFEEHAVEIFEEVENRLHVQKAVMVLLMKGD